MTRFLVLETDAYWEWFKSESAKSKVQIQKRISNIINEGHFGHIRDLDNDLYELKFNDGRRIYYTIIPINNVILLLGGNKNGQNRDIQKAKALITKAKNKFKITGF